MICVFPAAVVAMTGSIGVNGEDATRIDVEHPCGGLAVVERPKAATFKSTVTTDDITLLLTRAFHRVNDIKETYVCTIPSCFVSPCIIPVFFILHPARFSAHKLDDI